MIVLLGLSAPSLIQAGMPAKYIYIYRCARTCLWMWNHLIMPAKSSQWGCHAVWGNLFIRSFGFYGTLISHRFLIFWSSSLLTQLGLSPNLDFPSHSSKHSLAFHVDIPISSYYHFFLLECHNTQVLNKNNLIHYTTLSWSIFRERFVLHHAARS